MSLQPDAFQTAPSRVRALPDFYPGAPVTSLTKEIDEAEVLLVFFTNSQWCTYCTYVKPMVEQAASALHKEGRKNAVVSIDLQVMQADFFREGSAMKSPPFEGITLPALRLYVNGSKVEDLNWGNLGKFLEEDVPEPIANLVRRAYGDPTRMKASKADDWDRKYNKALSKGEEPIWVAARVSVELTKFLKDAEREKWGPLRDGNALELACGLGIDSAAIAGSSLFLDRQTRGVDISENAVAASTARYKDLKTRLSFGVEDVYAMPTPDEPLSFIYDNTVYQNARPYGKTNEYLKLVTRLTDKSPGCLVLVNVMAAEFGKEYVANKMYHSLPLNSAVELWRDFGKVPFELLFIEKGVYDMGPDFISHMVGLGVTEAEQIGGLPSWSLLFRRK